MASTRTLPRNALVKPRPRRAAPRQHPSDPHPVWHWIKRALSWLFFVAVTALLVHYARNIDWEDVLDSVRNTPARRCWRQRCWPQPATCCTAAST